MPLPEIRITDRRFGNLSRVYVAPNTESLKNLGLRAWDHGGKFGYLRPTLTYRLGK
jgi:hypothetical protein